MTAQLIVVSIWAAGKGRSSVHGCRESHGKNRAGMNTENAEAATPEASRSNDLSEELQSKAFCLPIALVSMHQHGPESQV